MTARLNTTGQVRDVLNNARENGLIIEGKIEKGMVVVKVGEAVVYRALAKSARGPWLVRYDPAYFEEGA
jgi:hypothetical protein